MSHRDEYGKEDRGDDGAVYGINETIECGEYLLRDAEKNCRAMVARKDGYECKACDERDLLATYHDAKAHPRVREAARMKLVAKLIGAF